MNVTFRLPSQELETQFVSESEAAGFVGLQGHRSVGGIRVSLYNAITIESVQALIDFMDAFRRQWG
jgi:phosphoserine aminotransferase